MDIKDIVKEIRTILKSAFPVKFGVTIKRFSMGESIEVSWTDGPTRTQVDELIGKYGIKGSRFISTTRKHTIEFADKVVKTWKEQNPEYAHFVVTSQGEVNCYSLNVSDSEFDTNNNILQFCSDSVYKLLQNSTLESLSLAIPKNTDSEPEAVSAPELELVEVLAETVLERLPTPEEQQTDNIAKKFAEGWKNWNVFDTGYFLKYKRPYTLTRKQVDWLRNVYVKQFKWGVSRDKAYESLSIDNMGTTYQREFIWQVSVHRNGSGTFEVLVKK
jgi:hypothetical protein